MKFADLDPERIESITPIPNELTPAQHDELNQLAAEATRRRKHLEALPIGTQEWHAARDECENFGKARDCFMATRELNFVEGNRLPVTKGTAFMRQALQRFIMKDKSLTPLCCLHIKFDTVTQRQSR